MMREHVFERVCCIRDLVGSYDPCRTLESVGQAEQLPQVLTAAFRQEAAFEPIDELPRFQAEVVCRIVLSHVPLRMRLRWWCCPPSVPYSARVWFRCRARRLPTG